MEGLPLDPDLEVLAGSILAPGKVLILTSSYKEEFLPGLGRSSREDYCSCKEES
jgi:hypothetical protein